MEKETITNLTLLVTPEDIVKSIVWPQLLQTLVLSLLTFYFGIRLYRRKTFKGHRDYDNIPGPPGLPVFGNLFEFAKPGIDYFKHIQKRVERYGKIFKLKIFYDNCFLCDPSHIQKLLSSTNPSHLNKPKQFYDMVGGDNIKHGLICSDYPTWKPHRKVISRLFTISGIQHQLTVMNKHVKKLVTDFQFILNNNNESVDVFSGRKIGKMIDLAELYNIFDIIMDTEMMAAEEIEKFHKNFLM